MESGASGKSAWREWAIIGLLIVYILTGPELVDVIAIRAQISNYENSNTYKILMANGGESQACEGLAKFLKIGMRRWELNFIVNRDGGLGAAFYFPGYQDAKGQLCKIELTYSNYNDSPFNGNHYNDSLMNIGLPYPQMFIGD